jgi:hypothetical protein
MANFKEICKGIIELLNEYVYRRTNLWNGRTENTFIRVENAPEEWVFMNVLPKMVRFVILCCLALPDCNPILPLSFLAPSFVPELYSISDISSKGKFVHHVKKMLSVYPQCMLCILWWNRDIWMESRSMV